MADKLTAGFTGDVEEPANDLTTRAKGAATAVKDEVGALAVTARDHSTATGVTFALVAAVAFGVGYILGANPTKRRYF